MIAIRNPAAPTAAASASTLTGAQLLQRISSEVFCGGVANAQCQKGKACVDNPSKNCNPMITGRGYNGIDIPMTSQACGTRGLVLCPNGRKYVDKPDGRDPVRMVDCPGIRV